MKTIKIVLTTMAVAAAFAAGTAGAANVNVATQLKFSFSGTADFTKSDYIKGTNEIGTTTTESLNEKTIYQMISSAVASDTNGAPTTNLPTDGYIAYNASSYDGGPEAGVGFFYVTNKDGFYFPLSGTYDTTNYYSYMELDSTIMDFEPYYLFLGFSYTGGTNYDFNQVDNYNYSLKTGNGSVHSTSAGLLYIHDDPLSFDDADYPSAYNANNYSVEIHGVFKLNVNYHDGSPSGGSASFAGNGNIIWNDDYGVLTSGKANFSQ